MSREKSKKNEDFSKRLKAALQPYTQTSVSTTLNCSQSVVSGYLSGNIPSSFMILSSLATCYEIDLNWLLTGKPAPGNTEEIEKYKNAIEKLTPFFYSFLIEMLERKEHLLREKEILLTQNLAEDPTIQVRLAEIQKEIDSLKNKYRQRQSLVQKALEPIGKRVPTIDEAF
jgi:transcriptional regulator with XRE-family HTH domain